MAMTPEQIRTTQQSMLIQNGAAMAMPQITGAPIKDIWDAIKQNNSQEMDRIYKSNPKDHQAVSGLCIALAATLGHTDTARVLIDNGANPDNGLSQAAEHGHIETASMLIDNGANSIQHAITKAIEKDNLEMFDFLLSKGGNLEHNFCEPLRWAAMHNSREVIHSILLVHRADPTETATEWLKENGHTYPLELLKKRDLNDKLQARMNAPKPTATKSKIKERGMKI